MLFDATSRTVRPTPNLATLRQASEALARAGHRGIEINAPGTTSTVTLEALAEAGATQVEPGHGLTGTTPLHVSDDLPEAPAVVYLTEVSHLSGADAFCFGGGLYIDPVFPAYQVKAIVAREPGTDEGALRDVEIPAPEAIDYYGMIDASGPTKPAPGDSVVFGFRPQAFVTRAFVAGVSGLSTKTPVVEFDLAQLRRKRAVAEVSNADGARSRLRRRLAYVVAEGAGFEPAIRFPAYTLSRRAPSAARPPLQRALHESSEREAIAPAKARAQAALARADSAKPVANTAPRLAFEGAADEHTERRGHRAFPPMAH